jgi:hypothetical protein
MVGKMNMNLWEIWLEDVDWIMWLVIVTVAGFCEHGTEHSGPVMYGID